MYFAERIHTVHRLLRYRFRTERAELRHLLSRDFDSGSLLDVGAYRGVYSYWMHRRFRHLPVVAFEPQPELVKFLSDFKETFRLDRLQIAALGLSSRSGTLPLRRVPCHWGGASIDEDCEQFEDDGNEIFDVSVTTIDEYMSLRPELRPVRFIKCDVEYHEDEVLAGAEQILLEDRPELLIEWTILESDRRQRLFELMQRLKYSIFQFEYGQLKLCESPERDVLGSWELSGNYVLIPNERAATL